MNCHGNSAESVVVGVVVDLICGIPFGRSAGRLSLSLWLTQRKPLGSHDSNGRRQG